MQKSTSGFPHKCCLYRKIKAFSVENHVETVEIPFAVLACMHHRNAPKCRQKAARMWKTSKRRKALRRLHSGAMWKTRAWKTDGSKGDKMDKKDKVQLCMEVWKKE